MKNDLRDEHLRQEVTVTLPLAVVLRIAEHSPSAAAAQAPSRFGDLPSIGAKWNGGVYAGLSVDSEQPVALVLLSGDEKMDWNAAVAWAEKQGGVLPSRVDQLVLFRNLKSEFQGSWYWSGEQSAGDSGGAWCQDFDYGNQYAGAKDGYFRARAVRRIPIQ